MNHHPAVVKILWMNMGAHAILYLALLFSSVASMQPIVTGTGNPVSKGSRPHVFYDVPVKRCLEVGPMSLDLVC